MAVQALAGQPDVEPCLLRSRQQLAVRHLLPSQLGSVSDVVAGQGARQDERDIVVTDAARHVPRAARRR